MAVTHINLPRWRSDPGIWARASWCPSSLGTVVSWDYVVHCGFLDEGHAGAPSGDSCGLSITEQASRCCTWVWDHMLQDQVHKAQGTTRWIDIGCVEITRLAAPTDAFRLPLRRGPSGELADARPLSPVASRRRSKWLLVHSEGLERDRLRIPGGAAKLVRLFAGALASVAASISGRGRARARARARGTQVVAGWYREKWHPVSD